MNIIGFDMETTGFAWAEGHRIVELACVLRRNGVKTSAWTKRYNPQRPIDAKASEVHGIMFDDVALCPLFETDAAKLSTLLNSVDVIVAHNGIDFDLQFLNHELRMAGVPEVRTPIVDTMKQGRWATFNGKSPSLGELCFATGVLYDPEKAHAALYDVEVMLEAFERAHAKGFFTIPAREERTAA